MHLVKMPRKPTGVIFSEARKNEKWQFATGDMSFED
jgi:hypothetical protein